MAAPEILRSDGTRLAGRMVQAGGRWTLTLAPCELTWIVIDHAVRLRFGDAVVAIENEFLLHALGDDHALDPGDRAGLGPLLALYPDTLTGGHVDRYGTLRLSLASGARIDVHSCPSYEAWQVEGPGDYLVVCIPGTEGALAVWGDALAADEWDTPEFWQDVERLRAGDATAVEPALRFLEDDPWSFRSGYAKEDVARVLARFQFDDQQQARLARVAIHAVDVGDRWEFSWYCRLANRIDAQLLRDDLTARLRSPDSGVARRALWMLARLRHPRLTDADLDDARSMVLHLASPPAPSSAWSRSPRNLAVRFWSLEWEAQLLAIARADPETRSAALRVLRSLTRLHLPDAAQKVADVVVTVLTEDEQPDSDWSDWFESALALTEPAELIDVVESLLDSPEPAVRLRAKIALHVLRGALADENERAGP